MNSLRSKSKNRSQKGTLALVGLLFLFSGAFRLATEAGQVLASEDVQAIEEAVTDARPLDRAYSAQPEQFEHALEALRNREARLLEREQEMLEREQSVEAAEDAIRTELVNLQEAEEKLRATIELASEAAENDIAQLTSMYANMKPKQAAVLFEQMDPSFAAGFLFRMPADSAARVMAGMSPERAYSVSLELAGRNTDIPME